MKFAVARDVLIKPLQLAAGVVEKKQTMPVLYNVLMELRGNRLKLTGSDLEVEMVASIEVNPGSGDAEITVPARKLVDIVKSLPEQSEIRIEKDAQKVQLRCGKSRYTLTSLPAGEFPNIEQGLGSQAVVLEVQAVKRLLESTSFSMAQQDVRYYLNGLLLELTPERLRAVATDGHRLAMADEILETGVSDRIQVIVPRKGILELSRLLSEEGPTTIKLALGKNHARIEYGDLSFTTKLIDGKFPDYERVLPRNTDRSLVASREELRSALTRASILSNEKYKGIKLVLSKGTLGIVANNPEQEEAHEELAVEFDGQDLEIGFNVVYLLDVLNNLKGGNVQIALGDANSSALISEYRDPKSWYVVMPMRL